MPILSMVLQKYSQEQGYLINPDKQFTEKWPCIGGLSLRFFIPWSGSRPDSYRVRLDTNNGYAEKTVGLAS
jgi:hypothetical protein